MVKLNILNMENFLNAVNSCTGKVHMLCPDWGLLKGVKNGVKQADCGAGAERSLRIQSRPMD